MRTHSLALLALAAATLPAAAQTVTGQAAFADYSQQKPGASRKITVGDLPEPKPTESVDNGPTLVEKPTNAWPIAPAGFKVTLYAGGDNSLSQSANKKQVVGPATEGTFREPRLIRTAPNGDLFVSDSAAGTVFVLRGTGPDGKAKVVSQYATGLDHPFGIAFYPAVNPKYVYVADTTTVVRFAYKAGDLKATGAPETLVPNLPGYAQLRGGGHWTRDVVFTKGGEHMLISVGSGSNVDDADTHSREFHRADVLEFTPEGKFVKVYASGIRNCVGEAINPVTGSLWCSVNERDNLGNNLVPDYITSVKEDSFFGWPWYYMGGHRDPRLPLPCANGTGPNHQAPALDEAAAKDCKREDIASKVSTPDILVQPHMASLQMLFYPGGEGTGKTIHASTAFPMSYDGNIFAAEHGSWNRAHRGGYEVIMAPIHAGKAEGSYQDFLTGFVTPDGQVWGRPVGVTVGTDGSLFVTDDGSRSVWHVTYTGSKTTTASN
ncbi:PQQ-dependent sugar dehydrogenase [Granulicella tundricola]|uniref:NHL repeat containing protein n=1 Tax=Granulicella tundricola (strain ATCC BAA-1859 / DSM 23138 / MP5ACTX9) TaxID=1198114 RepID=E8X1R1_GRATM|nr:PQQ-dependent sugar dehydrogenase [Granulicella tundricola]ADW67980.1 NHL repeat containing protein [Granulicella tundricola MP5ACTX9]